MDQLEYKALEKKEKQFYSQYEGHFFKIQLYEKKNSIRILDAFKINIGSYFFYYIYLNEDDFKYFSGKLYPLRSEKLIYSEGNFNITEIQNTYLEDLLIRFKLLNHKPIYFSTEDPLYRYFDWESELDNYYEKKVKSGMWYEYVKGIKFDVSKREYKRVLTIKAIPSDILQPLMLPKEKFVFSDIEQNYIDKLTICEGLFFLRDWNLLSQKREYFFLIGSKDINLFKSNIRAKIPEFTVDMENKILNEIRLLHFIFEKGKCVAEEYKWNKIGKEYQLFIDKFEQFESIDYFESYVAGMLIFSMQIEEDGATELLNVIDYAIYGYDYGCLGGYTGKRHFEYEELEKKLELDPYHFYLYLYPNMKYCLRSHIDEIYDRHILYNSSKLRGFLSNDYLDKISKNTFVCLPNSNILGIMRNIVKRKESDIHLRWFDGNDMTSLVDSCVLIESFIQIGYEKYICRSNESEEDDDEEDNRTDEDWIAIYADTHRNCRNELVRRTFYEPFIDFKYE